MVAPGVLADKDMCLKQQVVRMLNSMQHESLQGQRIAETDYIMYSHNYGSH